MKSSNLSQATFNSLIDLLADESVAKTEAVRDILKGKDFIYNSYMRPDVETPTRNLGTEVEEVYEPPVQPKKQKTAVKREIESNENLAQTLKPKRNSTEEKKQRAATNARMRNRLKASESLNGFMTANMPEGIDLSKQLEITDRYAKKLVFNLDGTPKNLISLQEKFKQEVQEMTQGVKEESNEQSRS